MSRYQSQAERENAMETLSVASSGTHLSRARSMEKFRRRGWTIENEKQYYAKFREKLKNVIPRHLDIDLVHFDLWFIFIKS